MSLRLSPILTAERKAPSLTLLISPLAGEMAGRPEGGVKDRNSLSLLPINRTSLFAAINAHPSAVVYFLHNGCVLPRVAFAPAKALNASSQTQGEKP
jgi:hypothetical protein